ncbi:MAG: class I SAM-dependent DNA methyltransferase, partial [Candidatus Nanohaloarchaea archaeon]
MSQSVQKQLSPYKNENLFSRHYLKKVIERRDLWEVDEQELENKLDKLKEIHEDESYYLPNRTNDEVELRNNYITKILREVLGFNKEQEKPGQASSRVPDYALYADESQKKEASDTGQYYENAVALVEAKAWKKDLEKRNASGSPAMENNPMKQVVDYLIDNKPQWGMLTNGKRWRLVNREATNRLDTYYEINIVEEIIEEDDREKALEKFKYFYVFFRKEALEGKEGDKILDEILEESIQYAKDIGEDLEENIYQALEWISKGYLNNSRNDGIEDEPIEKIHDNALILLYRLLFTHYADARDILGNPSGPYDRYNFSDFVDEVCEEIDEGEGYGKGGLLGSQLWEIFSLIDKGSEAKGIPKDEFHIPAYNGGLFAEEKHEFFQKYNIHDEYLAKVIDLVARTKKGDQKGKARVDYYDLSVRHLGGIYEGLLEYQLEKADEDMVEVKEDGDKVVKTVEEAEEDGDSFSDDDIIEEGQPYLVTDDGERKATGSYYTPDYIVKYIVENTVGPKVEEEIEDLETDEEKAEA